MNDILELKTLDLDALREVANIGAGHAATALSELTGCTILISVPRIFVALLEEIPTHVSTRDEPIAMVHMGMVGDLTGRALLLFPRFTSLRLSQLMLRRARGARRQQGELAASALKEAGNILAGAYMTALSDFLGLVLLPSPPSLSVDTASAVLSSAHLGDGARRDRAVTIETQFYLKSDEVLRGFLLLLPDEPSLERILRAVRVG